MRRLIGGCTKAYRAGETDTAATEDKQLALDDVTFDVNGETATDPDYHIWYGRI